MSGSFIIEGASHVTAKIAGTHFGYTKEYILLLIKEGKIKGNKVGHRWYVNMLSAEEYFKTVQVQRIAYREQISAERKKELEQHIRVQKTYQPQTALVETLAIIILGLSIGATGYLGTTSQSAVLSESNFSFVKNLAVSLYTLISPNETIIVTPSPTRSNVTQGTPESMSSAMQTERTKSTALIVLPPADEKNINTIAESFSDEVIVTTDPRNPNTGVITPIFKQTKGEPYRFLVVPIIPTS